jgi:hypothetical protein
VIPAERIPAQRIGVVDSGVSSRATVPPSTMYPHAFCGITEVNWIIGLRTAKEQAANWGIMCGASNRNYSKRNLTTRS